MTAHTQPFVVSRNVEHASIRMWLPSLNLGLAMNLVATLLAVRISGL